MSNTDDWSALIAEYIEGEITPDRLALLEAKLRSDPAFRRDFIQYLNVDYALGDLVALSATERSEAAVPVSANMAGSGTRPRSLRRRQGWIAAIAFVLLLGGLWFVIRPSNPRETTVAVRASDVDAVLLRDDRSWSSRDIPTGFYRLDKGLLHLQYPDNVELYVEAPAQFELIDRQRVRLQSGRISANVPDGSEFSVATPEATVIQSGTEYSVEAITGGSEVHVFQGTVRVRPARDNDPGVAAIDLKASQAVRIDGPENRTTSISLASDRFIRTFEEPRRNYAGTMKGLSPLAFYRMAIRDQGLRSDPPQYSGVVLTGAGSTPPHTRGVFAGGSLRVGGNSTGRGGRVDHTPALDQGQMSLVVFVYLESPCPGAVIATNRNGSTGNFALALDDTGAAHPTVRQADGRFQAVTGSAPLPLATWRHLVFTSDGEQLRLYEDGEMVSSNKCAGLSSAPSDPWFFGTASNGTGLLSGRIDELAIFGRAITAEEVGVLYRAAQQEIAQLAR